MKLPTHTKKSTKLGLLTLASSLLFAAGLAHAEYPDRAVSWVIPFPPGGPTDVATRVLADAFSKELDNTFVAENKSGASGSIGVSNVIRSKPDGYTIGTMAAPSLTAPYILSSKPYDLSTDVQPIGLAYVTPLLLVVNPNVYPDVTDIKSLAEVAKKEKGLVYTTAGIGSTAHLTIEIMKDELGFESLHVPYQGSSPAVTAVLSGDVPVMYSDAVAVLPQIRAGKLRAIAINSDVEIEGLEDVKTLEEQGVQSAKALSWGGVLAPRDIGEEKVKLLTTTLEKVLQDPDVAKRMRAVGAYPTYSTPEEMAEFIVRDSAIWEQAIKENDIKQ